MFYGDLNGREILKRGGLGKVTSLDNSTILCPGSWPLRRWHLGEDVQEMGCKSWSYMKKEAPRQSQQQVQRPRSGRLLPVCLRNSNTFSEGSWVSHREDDEAEMHRKPNLLIFWCANKAAGGWNLASLIDVKLRKGERREQFPCSPQGGQIALENCICSALEWITEDWHIASETDLHHISLLRVES